MDLLTNVPVDIAIMFNLILIGLIAYEKISIKRKNGNGKSDKLQEHINDQVSNCAARLALCNDFFMATKDSIARVETKVDMLLNGKNK